MEKYIQNSSNDHRQLGKEMDLFSFHPQAPGMPFFKSKGLYIKNKLIEIWRKFHLIENYQEVESPILLDKSLWEQSGHWDLFKENMFISQVDKHDFAIKPMSCPGAILLFNEKKRSVNELPLKLSELGHVHRNEDSGSLHGLLRVRSFIQDDAHIFCAENQLEDEIEKVLILFEKILNYCGFSDFSFELSMRGDSKKEKYLGSDEDWDYSEQALAKALVKLGHSYERKEGEAKFYGPSLDLHIKDSKGRNWQCSSVQLDFNLAHRFDVHYFNHQGKRERPFILHRAVFGSLERFIGILIEHYNGDFPLWLSPIQVKIALLNSNSWEYAHQLKKELIKRNIRVDFDDSENSLSNKIKKFQSEHIPFLVIIGNKEEENKKISLRARNGEKRNMINANELFEMF